MNLRAEWVHTQTHGGTTIQVDGVVPTYYQTGSFSLNDERRPPFRTSCSSNGCGRCPKGERVRQAAAAPALPAVRACALPARALRAQWPCGDSRSRSFQKSLRPNNSQAFLDSVNRVVRLARERYQSKLQRRSVARQLERLSPGELDVLNGLLGGNTSKQLARDLGLSPKTIDTHRANVMRKLQVDSHAELVKLVGSGSARSSATKSPEGASGN